MGQILFLFLAKWRGIKLDLTYNLSKNFVRFLSQCTFFEHFTIEFFKVNFHRVIKLIEVIHRDIDTKPSEHIKDFISWKTSTSIRIKFSKNLFNRSLSCQFMWKVKIRISFRKVILKPWSQPSYYCSCR